MELLLPLLALVGVALFWGDGGSDDGGGGSGSNPNNDFGDTDDTYAGADGNQNLYLGDGDDVATGGAGDDRIFLSAGDDATFNEDGSIGTPEDQAGNDFIRGGSGVDTITDSIGSNTIYGDDGWDVINGVDDADDRGTADTLFGGRGADAIRGDMGDTLSGGLNGGPNNDVMDRFALTIEEGGPVSTITDWEAGEQIMIRDTSGIPVFAEDLTTQVSANGEDLDILYRGAAVVTLTGVTSIQSNTLLNPSLAVEFGTDGDDTIEIQDGVTQVFTLEGDDTIGFADPSDAADPDRDLRINAGEGHDTVTSGLGNDIIFGNLGDDLIYGGGGFDEINGGFGADEIHSLDSNANDGSFDEVDGGGGEDRLIGDDGDILTGGRGVDAFFGAFDSTNDDPITITDFDPATEQLSVTVALPEDVVPIALTAEADGDNPNTLIKSGDRVLFILQNVLVGDVDTSGFAISNSTVGG